MRQVYRWSMAARRWCLIWQMMAATHLGALADLWAAHAAARLRALVGGKFSDGGRG